MKFYKLLANDLTHNGFTYKEGLNIDPVLFNPHGVCEPGGLYFTSLEMLGYWFHRDWPLVAEVTLPPDARVYAEPCDTKWKADRLELSNIQPLVALLNQVDTAIVEQWMKQTNGWTVLGHIHEQTEQMCMNAIRSEPSSLRFVHQQTLQLNEEATRLEIAMFRWTQIQSPDMCFRGVRKNGFYLACVKELTYEICLAAVTQNGLALVLVPDVFRTPQMCLAALNQDRTAIAHMSQEDKLLLKRRLDTA